MLSPLRSRRFAAVVIAAAALAGLTACTGSPAGSNSSAPSSSAPAEGGGEGTQSTEEACQLVQDTITDATAEFEQATGEDPQAAAEAFQAAAQSIADASAEVTNEEVAAILPDLQQLFESVAEVLPAIIEGDTSKLTEFEEIGTDLQSSMQQFQELCGPVE
jgi:ABC-type glycerol-3-phosphate transport system substrate-binding protein